MRRKTPRPSVCSPEVSSTACLAAPLRTAKGSQGHAAARGLLPEPRRYI